ncbi:hypothetical protein GCM10022224_090450 [Nonomuraea antimicrobica]|uniref:AMP-dependent ligase C-terminal domain-containing protein n=1 Tax=Nonomuraea antimicrobica TaxID=561173 RepID=A0ABP7DYI0_9ACTN
MGHAGHAYENAELYRKKFDDAVVKPNSCRSPATTEADLRDTYPYGMFAVPMDEVHRGRKSAHLLRAVHRWLGAAQREAVERAIAKGIKDGVGVSVEVKIVEPETLERSPGMLRRVKDLCAH